MSNIISVSLSERHIHFIKKMGVSPSRVLQMALENQIAVAEGQTENTIEAKNNKIERLMQTIQELADQNNVLEQKIAEFGRVREIEQKAN